MLYYIYIALSVILGVITAYVSFDLALLWLALPIALGYFVAVILIHIAVCCSIAAIFFPVGKEPERLNPLMHFLMVETVYAFLKVMRVKFTLEGEELLPKDKAFTFISNHLSMFDPLAAMVLLRKYGISFISKPENFKIPVAGPYMRINGYLAIDREDVAYAMTTFREAAVLLKEQNRSVGVYPEGTRSKTGELGEFKNGVFFIPKKAKSPIVVSRIIYSAPVLKNFPFKRTKITIKILSVIDVEELSKMRTNSVGEYVRDIIARSIEEDENK